MNPIDWLFLFIGFCAGVLADRFLALMALMVEDGDVEL